MTKILIVDDESNWANDIINIVTQLGYEIPPVWEIEKPTTHKIEKFFAARNKTDVLDNLDRINPDIILLDISFDEENYDGIDIASDIQKKGYDIPIIFLTNYDNEDFIEKAKKIDPYGYFLKNILKSKFGIRSLDILIQFSLHRYETIKEKERLLKMSENWLDVALKSIEKELAVIATDNEGYIKLLNEEAETLTHYNRIKAAGKHIEKVCQFQLSDYEIIVKNIDGTEIVRYHDQTPIYSNDTQIGIIHIFSKEKTHRTPKTKLDKAQAVIEEIIKLQKELNCQNIEKLEKNKQYIRKDYHFSKSERKIFEDEISSLQRKGELKGIWYNVPLNIRTKYVIIDIYHKEFSWMKLR